MNPIKTLMLMIRLIRILIAVTALTSCIPASAETKSNHDSSHFGVRAQLDLNRTVKSRELIKWGPGFSIGVAYYAPFGRFTYFDMALMLSRDTFRYDGWGGAKYSQHYMDGSIIVTGLRLPLDIGLKFFQRPNIKLSVFTGPSLYVDFSCRAKYTDRLGEWEGPVDKKYTISGMEIGWNGGVACDFLQHWRVQFEYMYGISNMAMTTDLEGGPITNLRRTEMTIGLVYNF